MSTETTKSGNSTSFYIDPGTYLAKPLDWGVRDKTARAGNTYTIYFIEFEIVEEGNFKGRKAIYEQNLYTKEGSMTPKTAEILMKNMQAIGMTNTDPITPEVTPENVKLVFELDTYEGKTSSKLKYINSLKPRYNPKEKMLDVAEDKKKQLRAVFQTAFQASAQADTTTSAPTPRKAAFAASSGDDDIPF